MIIEYKYIDKISKIELNSKFDHFLLACFQDCDKSCLKTVKQDVRSKNLSYKR